jgi:hypothetical protein
MANQQIIDYIKTQESAGYSEVQLKKALLENGYNETDVNEAITFVNSSNNEPISSPQSTPESNQETVPSNNTTVTPIKKRNPWIVILLSLFTFGIYFIIWTVQTTKELRGNTKSAPNPLLLFLMLVPIVNFFVIFYYFWKYCKAINELTGFNNVLLFILYLVFTPVGMFLIQSELNKKATI